MKFIRSFLAVAVLAWLLLPSCKKHSGPGLPAVTNFLVVDSGSFQPGGRATVTVNSPSLADGTYTFYYFVFPNGYNQPYSTPVHSTLVMSNHTGTFQTVPLDTSAFVLLLTDSIVNEGGGGVSVGGAIVTLIDSTGMMTLQMNGRDTFRTPSVVATNDGGLVQVVATSPVWGSIGEYRYVYLYLNNSLGVQSFSNGSNMSTYALFLDSATIANNFVYGEITVTALTPLVAGSFSVTCADSTKMSGTFSCPAP